MPQVTLMDAIRTRASANRRRATLRRVNRWDESSPLTACGDVFEREIQSIERTYSEMIARIENATINL